MADASLGTAVLHTRLDTSALRAGLQTAERDAETSARKITEAFNNVGQRLQGVGARMTVGITAPLTALGAVGVRSAMQLETFSKSLTVLIGDADRATAAFEELYEFSANTTFEWRSLTEGTRVLAAFGVEAEDLVPTLSMLGDVAAGLDTPLEDLAQIFGRVRITGRAGMEEINRLAGRGVPVYTELARVMGVSEAGVRDLVSAGAIGFPQIEAMFRNLTSEGGMFFGMMEAQTDTTAGRLARLKDSFEQVTDIIGERLIPSFDRLIATGQRATDWFVNLDETTQGLFVGLGTTLALTGPLMVGIGTLAVQLPKVAAGFKAVQIAMGPAFGPVGIAVSAIGIVAGLAVALSGRADSLDRAIDKTTDAIASGDKDSMLGAFDELIATARGPLKDALKGIQDDLRQMGDVGVAEAQRILAQMQATALDARRGFLGTQLFGGPSQLNTELARAGGVMGMPDLGKQVQDALNRNELVTAIDLLNDAMVALDDFGLPPSMYKAIADFHADVANITSFSFTPTGAPGGTPSPGSVPPGGASGRAQRTWEDILAELDAAGTQAMRLAAFEGTREAAIEATQSRMRLINSAIAELMADPHYGVLPDGVLDGLRERLQAAGVELEGLLAGPRGARPLSPALQRAMEAAEVGGPGAGMSTGMTAAEYAQALEEARTRLGPVATKWADYLAQELEREVARFQSGLPDGQRRRFFDTWTGPSANVGGAVALRQPAGMAANADGQALDSLSRQWETYLDRETERQLERMRNMDLTTTNTDRAIRAERELEMARQASARESAQLLADFQRSEAERIAALRFGGENARAYTEQVQLQAQVSALAAREGITLTEALRQITDTGRSVADIQDDLARAEEAWRTAGDEAGRLAARRLVEGFQAELDALQPRQLSLQPFAQVDGMDPREWQAAQDAAARATADAAEQFQKTVISAGLSFTDTVVKGIQSGDFGSVVSGGFGAVGSILGGAGLGTLGTVLAGLFPIVGGLLGGLFGGGGGRDLESTRAAGVTPRGAPAIDLKVMINQSLNIQSLTDPASRRAVDGLLDDMVRRIEDTLKRNVIPRLNALDGGAA